MARRMQIYMGRCERSGRGWFLSGCWNEVQLWLWLLLLLMVVVYGEASEGTIWQGGNTFRVCSCFVWLFSIYKDL